MQIIRTAFADFAFSVSRLLYPSIGLTMNIKETKTQVWPLEACFRLTFIQWMGSER